MRKPIKFDTVLAVSVLSLLIFGLVMITSIGVPKSIALSAQDVLYPNCSDANVDCYLLFKKHLTRLFIGSIVAFIAFHIPTKYYRRAAPFLFIGIIILLFAVVLFGSTYGTIAKNWITIAGNSLQPSEFAKLGLVLYLASWLSKKGEGIKDFSNGFMPFGLVVGAVLLPIMLQNDFGSMLLLSVVAGAMVLVAGARKRHLAGAILAGLFFMIITISVADHVRERFAGFMTLGEECLEDYCWQSQQANIAVSTGGFWGKGLTQGVQKSYWLPQASDDFIFAASSEELGFLRISFVVLAYFLISYRGFLIASHTQSTFEKLVAVGLTVWISGQAYLNIAVNTALFPVTGITLPFVSYGGTSLVASMIAMAILLNISKFTTYYASSTNRGGYRRSRGTQRSRYRRA